MLGGRRFFKKKKKKLVKDSSGQTGAQRRLNIRRVGAARSSVNWRNAESVWDAPVAGVQTCAFFFQAEDGIRDATVTGVQTCALPIMIRHTRCYRDWSSDVCSSD